MDELVRLAFEHELVVETEIECDRHAVGGCDGPALSPAPLDENLIGPELMSGRAEASVRELLELARGERQPHGAELLAELRAEQRQIRLHAQLDRLDGAELDVLHAQLVRHLIAVPVEGRPFDDEPAQRLPQLDSRARARLPAELHHTPHLGDLVEEGAVRLGDLGPAREVYRFRPVEDERPPEMVGDEGKDGRERP